MRRSLATALALGVAFGATAIGSVMESRDASAQGAPGASNQCNDFVKFRDEAQKKGMAVRAATERHADRKEVCNLMISFVGAEGAMIKFLEDNKTWCGVPDQAILQAKASHEKSMKFRVMACTDAPESKPKVPTLSDALGTPSTDTGKNTKTGRGTFDSLTGNPLAK
jgi:hypothetical protein